MKKQTKLTDWALDLLALLLLGIIWLADYLHLSANWELALQLIVIVGVYSLIILWLWTHPAAMIVQSRSTKAKLAIKQSDAERRPPLTEVQAHYQHIIEINSKRKL